MYVLILLNKCLVCIVKHYRKISYVLGGILLFAVGMLAFQVYENGVEGRGICKRKAEASLKSVTELWANREFDKLGIPYSVGGGEPKEESKQRRIVLAEGETVVAVDSIKEEKRLIASHNLSAKVRFLFLVDKAAFSLLNELWQEDLNDRHTYCSGALMLQSELPGDRKGKKFMAGDSTLMTDKFKLGTYYLDDMYFLELTAYLSLPSPWLCADWGKTGIVSSSIIVILCLCIFVLLFWHNRKKDNNDEAVDPDDCVTRISENKYQIGGVLFDEEACTLTFEDRSVVKCPMQSYKLLSAFVHAENHFLSNNRIVEVCGWSLENININQNRRVTVSLLRKLLDAEKSHVKIESGQNEQKEQGFYMLVEK